MPDTVFVDLGSWHHSMYPLGENEDLKLTKSRRTPDYEPNAGITMVNINVFADPCIWSALFSRRVVRGMNTLNWA